MFARMPSSLHMFVLHLDYFNPGLIRYNLLKVNAQINANRQWISFWLSYLKKYGK